MGSKQSQIESQDKEMLQKLMSLKQLILYLDENNINESVDSSLFYFDEKFPYSFNFIICSILYSCFIIEFNKSGMEYLKQIEIRERDIYNNENYKVIDIFIQFLFNIHSQESNFLLNKIIENDLTDSNICKNKVTPYFAHYMSNEELSRFKSNHLYKFFFDNHEELSKNDWELHKKFIEEGHNPNEIALIIRNDEIEKLQEISSKNDFDFNQIIDPSLYERCSFINEENVTLIDYAAFFGSIKCFRYLLMNSANVYYAGKYAVAVGNEEIIHLCEQNHSSFEGAYKAAIIFHRNDIFKYLYENKIKEINNLEKLGKKCIIHHNYEVLAFLFENGMKVNDSLIIVSIETGNIFILKYLLGKNPISINFMEIRTFSGNKELFNFIIRNKYVSNKNKNIFSICFDFNKIGYYKIIFLDY